MTTHTPGPWPWRVHEAHYTDLISVRFEDGTVICQMWEPNAKEHASLIAAAPDTAAERDRLKAINADLMAALTLAQDELGAAAVLLDTSDTSAGKDKAEVLFNTAAKVRAAIAKAQGDL